MGKNLWAGILRFIAILSLCALILFIIYYGITLLYPFLIGLLFAYWIQPMTRFFESHFQFKRTVSVFVSIFILFAGLITLFIILFTQIYHHMNHLFMIFPEIFAQFVDMYLVFFESHLMPTYEKILSHFESFDTSTQQGILDIMRNFGTNLIQDMERWIHSFLDKSLHFIQKLPYMLTTIMFALLATFFLAKDWEHFYRLMLQYLPKKLHQKGRMILIHLQKALLGWFKAQIILMLFTGILVYIGLLILRMPYAPILAICIACVDLLPLLGTGVIFLPWIIAMLVTGNMPLAISLLILYILVMLQRQILEPKILSGNLGIDPLATLISVFVGFQLLGFWGLVLGPSILVLASAFYQAGIFSDLWHYIQTGKRPYS